MNCMSCNRQLTDDEIYVCAQCADEYANLVDKVYGDGDAEAKATAL